MAPRYTIAGGDWLFHAVRRETGRTGRTGNPAIAGLTCGGEAVTLCAMTTATASHLWWWVSG